MDRDGTFLETLGPGDFFGEMAILGPGRRNATVTVASPVELLVLFGTEFRALESQHPQVAELIRQKVSERVERGTAADASSAADGLRTSTALIARAVRAAGAGCRSQRS